MCTMCVPGVWGSHKRLSAPSTTAAIVVSCHMGAGKQIGVFCKSSKYSNSEALLEPPIFFLKYSSHSAKVRLH